MHYFDGGGSIGRFPLATNESYVNKSTGEKVSNTEWHNLVVRNKAAEICEKYLSKGDRIYVEGRIKTRKWTGEDGADRYSTEINVNEFTFLTTKKDVSQTSPSDSVPNTNSEAVPLEKDDLPF
jgi:single-strand DNA-binding protein